jgi:Asp-tRNA(Asn)/Glu-tRNA(Gln) amidotransferase C subunit
MDFLWHAVSEKEKEDIKKEAKRIMDSFSKKLERINKKTEEPIIERNKCEREETPNEEKTDSEFRKIMFENAPNKENDFIIGEKGGW